VLHERGHDHDDDDDHDHHPRDHFIATYAKHNHDRSSRHSLAG
jgi:hypothetical protein